MLPLIAGGCAIGPMAAPAPSIAVVDRIGAAVIPPLAVGEFKPGDQLPRDADHALVIRASTIRPAGGSFARQLGDTLSAQLEAAGRYDRGAPIVVSGRLIENEANTAIGVARARLAAEFTVARGGREVWRKTFVAERRWDSSFFAAQAVPAAATAYAALYTDLIGQLVDDPGFRASAAGRSG